MVSSVVSSVTSSAAGAVTMPSADVASIVVSLAPGRITFVIPIVDAFASTTSNVTVASVPSASGAAPARDAAEILTLPSDSIAGVANAPAGR